MTSAVLPALYGAAKTVARLLVENPVENVNERPIWGTPARGAAGVKLDAVAGAARIVSGIGESGPPTASKLKNCCADVRLVRLTHV